ncbi:formate hydrogenlyase subunit 6/NADH:ubiquinone oxidoreductase subunit I [Methanomicrobium sp. W14]|jgi:ech hydrogenase subunit F|uniref:4Fe-4S dicluster domain-containing protein n=1 Tax=Methanomicrobium sp. W14 TaxID=2817839 RepID=UPI001AE484FC|nr:4Fe-4S dicluster domain-containing protein [Methanomicrobium sp. W14]MBP2132696.1 formate hydrogenlyase subunit 6/NADH:ubiquinone oxidoreductase subunit I [Methanomicrobium sp. W14]
MQLFSITKILLKTLGRGPSTLRYPSEPAKRYENSRGQVEINIDDCIFCGLCRMHCPADAITVDKSSATWSIDRFRCISCNSCVETCPKSCLKLNNVYHEPVISGPLVESFKGTPKAQAEKSEE